MARRKNNKTETAAVVAETPADQGTTAAVVEVDQPVSEEVAEAATEVVDVPVEVERSPAVDEEVPPVEEVKVEEAVEVAQPAAALTAWQLDDRRMRFIQAILGRYFGKDLVGVDMGAVKDSIESGKIVNVQGKPTRLETIEVAAISNTSEFWKAVSSNSLCCLNQKLVSSRLVRL